MRRVEGEVFAHHPGAERAPERGEWGPKQHDFDRGKPKIDPESTQNSPNLTQIGPCLARKSPSRPMFGSGERGEGFFGEREGGVVGGLLE